MAIFHTVIAALAVLGPAQAQKLGYDKGDIEWAANTMICYNSPPEHEQSGYVTVPRGLGNETAELFFWHFPAYEGATTAPLAVIIGGGLPGVPATEKIFGRTGPCTWDGRTEKVSYGNLGPSTNYFGYNMRVNTLHIDAPTPVGFSHGNPANVSTTKRDIWHFLQIFLREFDQYEGRDVALWNYDFGAHYATHAAAYIHQQNERIREGALDATVINLTSLGLVSPLLDLPIQHKASIEYAQDNPYGQVITRGLRNDLLADFAANHSAFWRTCAEDIDRNCKWEQSKHYRTQLHRLTIGEHYVEPPPMSVHEKLRIDKEVEEMEREEKKASQEVEKEAEKVDEEVDDEEEEDEVEEQVVEEEEEEEPDVASYDPWDIRLPRPGDRWRVLSEVAPERSERTERFMGREELQNWVGADLKGKKAYSSLNHVVWVQVMEKQEMMRSSLKALRQVMQSGIRVLIVGGDADMMSCPLGVSRVLDAVEGANATTWSDMEPQSFMARSRPMEGPVTEKDKLVGKIGEYREKENVSWLLLNEKGHDIETEDPGTMLLLFTRHVHGWPFDGYLKS